MEDEEWGEDEEWDLKWAKRVLWAAHSLGWLLVLIAVGFVGWGLWAWAVDGADFSILIVLVGVTALWGAVSLGWKSEEDLGV